MKERINEYIKGRRIKIDDYNFNYSTDIHYCNKVYTIYFFFNDINMKISYSIDYNYSNMLNERLKYIFESYIPQKINENVNVKVYLRKLKLEKIRKQI